MRIAWRISVVVALAALVFHFGPKWLNRGVRSGAYGYASAMLVLLWSSCLFAAWLGPHDARFGRMLIGGAALIVVPILCYHIYDATGSRDTMVSAGGLVTVASYTYLQVI